ncbi:hypothetical protein MW871_15950 [Flavobacterium sp. I-SCBP12n]|uniref:Uncharacterized protein n=1 Tax=Flavobacterium pygoscelis TaxID=2893176 RepID=A0A9X1XT59_9FLAO|nr:hypothetical protein [Flavobacterium pygoscelis]MCK8143323.1 hypothetical protein [Flavobacterium pygoscelis]MCK8143385.1 hypothetical protein [Flavobacterium pygoscelis]
MRRFKAIILSWDFGITLLSVFATYLVLPEYINMNFALSFYNVAMTVLSIIFSLFFTAMAIIMSSSDNDFIEFLEEKNTFTELLWSFKFTLFVLFLSLILSIILYSGTSYWIETNHNETWLQDYKLLLLLQFCFLYGMIATWFSIMDTVKFSKYRSDFLKEQKTKKQKTEE